MIHLTDTPHGIFHIKDIVLCVMEKSRTVVSVFFSVDLSGMVAGRIFFPKPTQCLGVSLTSEKLHLPHLPIYFYSGGQEVWQSG